MGKGKAFMAVLLILLMISTGVCAETSDCMTNTGDVSVIQPRYSYTERITAELSFSNGKADCYGSVAPSDWYDSTITVTLYKKNGTKWDYITSWSGSATDGLVAAAGGSASVSRGTYKVVARGNIAHLEYPTASIEKTY